ncbi:MAG TPA: nitrate ABC transporter substrate-binding protein [Xanthomonadaceae bacterium]|nr:nitrate ABC transporter substrate-binding protein [Xanthomonadaceae bacterium]
MSTAIGRAKAWARGIGALLAAVALLSCAGAAAAQDKPDVIRIGAPSVVTEKDNFYGSLGIARYKGWLDQEFKKDGIRIQLVGYRGGAPLVGQALANGQIDFAWQGDMLSLIGKSSGVKSRIVLPMSRLTNAYLAVAPKSPIKSIQDLRGKRVSYAKGNQIQLQVIHLLAGHGMSERDIRSVALDPATASAALASGDVDAVFGGADLIALRDRGLAKIVYSTRGKSVDATSFNSLLVSEEFAQRHPELVTRLVKVLVRSLHWASQPQNADELFRIWSLGGPAVSRYYLKEDYQGRPLPEYLSPLFDPLYLAHYRRTQDSLVELKLLRGQKVDIERWIDRRYLDQALAQLGLRGFWSPLDANGKPLATATAGR